MDNQKTRLQRKGELVEKESIKNLIKLLKERLKELTVEKDESKIARYKGRYIAARREIEEHKLGNILIEIEERFFTHLSISEMTKEVGDLFSKLHGESSFIKLSQEGFGIRKVMEYLKKSDGYLSKEEENWE